MTAGERGGGWQGGLTARRVVLVAALFIAGYFSISIVSTRSRRRGFRTVRALRRR
jgi:hypothetical protein